MQKTSPEERPPIFKTWNQIHFFVVLVFVLIVTFLYWFSTLYN